MSHSCQHSSYHEEVRGVASNSQPEAPQCLHQTQELPHGNPSYGHKGAAHRVVGRYSRFKGRVPTRASEAFRQEVARFLHRKSELQIQGSPLRTFNSTQGIHTGGQSHGGVPSTERKFCLRLSGRLADNGPIARDPPSADPVCQPTGHLPGIANQRKKARPGIIATDPVPGSQSPSQRKRAVPTEERVTATTGCAAGLLAAEIAPARQWMRLLGLIASLTAILPLCSLHMRVIQLHVLSRSNLRGHPLSTPIPSSQKIRKELRWWTHPHNLKPGQPFLTQTPCSCLTTDASKAGWGAHWGDIMLSGRWTPAIAKLHINRLELLAIHLALRRLLQQVKGQTVKVRCDNLSVVMYINRQGGTRSRSLSLQTVKLLIWCQCHGIQLQAEHLPGADNKLADALSREGTDLQTPRKVRGTSVEWQLSRVVCQTLFNQLEKPSIDLFTTRENSQLPVYCTWGQDPMAFAADAMTISWNRVLAYAFPPSL